MPSSPALTSEPPFHNPSPPSSSPLLLAHSTTIRPHNAPQKGKISQPPQQVSIEDAAWARLSTPLWLAEYDLDQFLAYYFLTDGKPDPSKTTEPLALRGFRQRRTLHVKAGSIPGLWTRSGGLEPNRTLCIGWDFSAVCARASEVYAEVEREEKARADDRWAEATKEHQALITQTKIGAQNVYHRSSTPAILQKIVGSYIVRCLFIEAQWPTEYDLTLDIHTGPSDDVMEAAVDFNVIEGTMLLGLEDSALDEVDVDTPEIDHGDEDEDEYEYEKPPASMKRAALKLEGKPGGEAPMRCILLRIRGRETGEGETFYDSEHGYLNFTDDTFTRFKGVVNLPHVGSNVNFEGLKVDAQPRKQAETFGDFSAANYGRALHSRWG